MSILSSRNRLTHAATESEHTPHNTRLSLGPGAATTLLTAVLLAPAPAIAVDGCLVLLCFAAPSWKGILQCVPPIKQVLKDLAHGKGFPTCGLAGPANVAQHKWSSAPGHCPPQYTHTIDGEGSTLYWCEYAGAVSVSIEGLLFTRTWWNMSGNTVTDFSPSAKAQLGSWDTQFDDEYAAWKASHPPSSPAEVGY